MELSNIMSNKYLTEKNHDDPLKITMIFDQNYNGELNLKLNQNENYRDNVLSLLICLFGLKM